MHTPSPAPAGHAPPLAGRRAIVTGGARGIGAAIADRLAASGARVAILDLLDAPGREQAERIGGSFHRVDLCDAEDTSRAVAAAIEALGGVDVLVNNAGILRFAPLLEIEPDQWDRTFAINTRSMLLTTQVAARAMIAAGHGGRIINLASMAGKAGGAGQADYAASKAAVIALTRVTALELGSHGITANSLCPGYVLTEMGAATRTPEMVAKWSSMSPLGRCAEPDEVADMALFLASDQARYCTGQAMNVSGGMVMH